MKKTVKSNPLKTFNDNKALAQALFKKSLLKAEFGISTGKQNRLARQEKRVYNNYTDAKTSGNTEKSGKLYDKLIDKQTKSIKAGVNVQYKVGGAQAAFKKLLPKAQPGQSVGTPFQDYMKIPGAVASDTIVSRKPMGTTPQKTELYYREMLEKPSPKNPKNKGTLINAIEKTYGMDVWNRPGPQGPTNKKNLTPSQDKEMRKMGPNKQKMGGATKATKFAALAPPYNKATFADRIVGAKKNKKK